MKLLTIQELEFIQTFVIYIKKKRTASKQNLPQPFYGPNVCDAKAKE
jgi:hypothetical protein